jgi:hypothetical protein
MKAPKTCFWVLVIIYGACGRVYEFLTRFWCKFFLTPISSKSSLALIESFDFPAMLRNVLRMASYFSRNALHQDCDIASNLTNMANPINSTFTSSIDLLLPSLFLLSGWFLGLTCETLAN